MNTDKYTLAIVIPCWNEEKRLPKMLECLIKQTYQDWQAFCVDDKSKDNTAEIIKAYQTKDNRIHYICRNREPKGGQTCRNIGIEMAKDSKYIVFFDADDLVAPYCLEQRVGFLEQNSELDCGVFPTLAYTDNIFETQGPIFGVKIFEDDIQAMIGFTVPFQTATNIYRYSSLKNTCLNWDEKIKSYQDVEFNIQFLLSGIKYAFADTAKADYFYKVDNEGVASNIKKNLHYESHILFIDKVTKSVSLKYGSKYDFYLEAMITYFLGLFRNAWFPYFKLLRLGWLRHNYFFKLRIILYLLILKKDRRLIFYKYRKYSKKQNAVWLEFMKKKRIDLLEKGVQI